MTAAELRALMEHQRARHPADADALDRLAALLALVEGGGDDSLPAPGAEAAGPAAPELSLPLRIQPAKASALGWSTELFSLTLLVANAEVRDDLALVQRGRGPVLALCAEYDRPLTALAPLQLAGYALDDARDRGVPMLRLPGGFWSAPLRLQPPSRAARLSARQPEAESRAEAFLAELNEAWGGAIGAVLRVAWPVYRAVAGGPLLDGAFGDPLPALDLH